MLISGKPLAPAICRLCFFILISAGAAAHSTSGGLYTSSPPPLGILKDQTSPPRAVLQAAATSAPEEVQAVAEWNQKIGGPAQNGFARPLVDQVAVKLDARELAPRLEGLGGPQQVEGGLALILDSGDLVWGTKIRVEEAYRLRLHLAEVNLPDDAELWVSGSNEALGPITIKDLMTKSGLWTPSVAGPTVALEVLIPAAGGPQIGQFVIDQLMEIFRLDYSGAPLIETSPGPQSTSCLMDAQCVASSVFSSIESVQRAIAHMQYIDGGSSWNCTGGLLRDTDGKTTIPYFLTANHCISSQSAASSLDAFWDFFSDYCGGPWPELSSLPRSVGSTLLASNSSSDFTLLKLNSIPSGRYLLNWNANSSAVPHGTALHRVSHPYGFAQMYSSTWVNTSTGTCAFWPRPNFLYQGQNFGGTFVGSSGSPVLLAGGYTVGQLTGQCGPNPGDGCDYSNYQVDGAFSSTYGAIAPFLNPPRFTLTIQKSGTGTGTVTSSPSGINCGSTCSDTFATTTPVSLSATPDSESTFGGWSGDSDCLDGTISMTANKTCTATFDRIEKTLNVYKAGAGSGTVKSKPSGINCGSDCWESFYINTTVELNALPVYGSMFAGWSGDGDCQDGVLLLDENTSCTASFSFCSLTSEVELAAQDVGDIRLFQACNSLVAGEDGFRVLAPGGDVTFRAGNTIVLENGFSVDSGARFTAIIGPPAWLLQVNVIGNGSGRVISNPGGIDCGGVCQDLFVEGATVVLQPLPDSGSTFTGWGGPPDCSDGIVEMHGDLLCEATFRPLHSLTIGLTGTGTGTVTSSPSGISCGSDCYEEYAEDTTVDLMASPAAGSAFTGWSGDPDCLDGQVELTSDRSCLANFERIWTLTVEKTGVGSGDVTSEPVGIDCGDDCSEPYLNAVSVTLTPASHIGSTFGGWSGHADCTDGVVLMDAHKTCTAVFNIQDPVKLVAPDPEPEFNDYFGKSVAVDGDTVAVGAHQDRPSGAVFLFQRGIGGAENWGLLKRLTAPGVPDWANFGSSVAISGDTLVAAASGAEVDSVFIFERHYGGQDNWGFRKKIPIPCCPWSLAVNQYVALDGDTLVVGAPADDGLGTDAGTAYVFYRDEGGEDHWGQVAQLGAGDFELGDTRFGYSVSIHGDLAAIGTPGDGIQNASIGNIGAVYLFSRNEGGTDNWGEVVKLSPSNQDGGSFMGASVAFNGDTVIAGAIREDTYNTGRAYVFKRGSGGGWSEIRVLRPNGLPDWANFGHSAAMWQDRAVVGAYSPKDNEFDPGAAYLFQRDIGGADKWGQEDQLLAWDGQANDEFGYSVAINGNVVVVGAWRAHIGSEEHGAVYLFFLEPIP